MPDPKAQLMRGLMEALLLESLVRGPKHGYALMKEVETVFGAAHNKNQIYPLLSRLESDGLIAGKAGKEPRARTEYAITAKGRALLDEYRSMPPEFMRIVEELWGVGGPAATTAAPAGSPPEARQRSPRPHDHLVVSLRMRPGAASVEVVFENLETGERACARCKTAGEVLSALRKRFFDWPE